MLLTSCLFMYAVTGTLGLLPGFTRLGGSVLRVLRGWSGNTSHDDEGGDEYDQNNLDEVLLFRMRRSFLEDQGHMNLFKKVFVLQMTEIAANWSINDTHHHPLSSWSP